MALPSSLSCYRSTVCGLTDRGTKPLTNDEICEMIAARVAEFRSSREYALFNNSTPKQTDPLLQLDSGTSHSSLVPDLHTSVSSKDDGSKLTVSPSAFENSRSTEATQFEDRGEQVNKYIKGVFTHLFWSLKTLSSTIHWTFLQPVLGLLNFFLHREVLFYHYRPPEGGAESSKSSLCAFWVIILTQSHLWQPGWPLSGNIYADYVPSYYFSCAGHLVWHKLLSFLDHSLVSSLLLEALSPPGWSWEKIDLCTGFTR